MFCNYNTHFKTQDALRYYVNFLREQSDCDADYEKHLQQIGGCYVAGNCWTYEDILTIAYEVAEGWEEC